MPPLYNWGGAPPWTCPPDASHAFSAPAMSPSAKESARVAPQRIAARPTCRILATPRNEIRQVVSKGWKPGIAPPFQRSTAYLTHWVPVESHMALSAYRATRATAESLEGPVRVPLSMPLEPVLLLNLGHGTPVARLWRPHTRRRCWRRRRSLRCVPHGLGSSPPLIVMEMFKLTTAPSVRPSWSQCPQHCLD